MGVEFGASPVGSLPNAARQRVSFIETEIETASSR